MVFRQHSQPEAIRITILGRTVCCRTAGRFLYLCGVAISLAFCFLFDFIVKFKGCIIHVILLLGMSGRT